MSLRLFISFVFLFVLVFLLPSSSYGASHIAHFVLEPSVKTAQAGSTFYVNVVLSLNQPQGIISGTLNFTYDKQYLEIEQVIPSFYYWSNLQYQVNQTGTGTSIPFHNQPAYTGQTKPNNRSDTLMLLVVRAKQTTPAPVVMTLGQGTVTTGMSGGWDVISPATVEIKAAATANPAFIPLTHAPSPTPPTQTPNVTIQMTKEDKLIPQTASIGVGGVVRFINKDNEGPHRAREVNGLFDSYYLSYNQTFDYKFTSPGTYTFFDPGFEGSNAMRGTITVGGGNGSPTATPTITPTPSPSQPITTTYTVSVATKNSTHPQFGIGSPIGYVIDGVQGKELTLIRGKTYAFNTTNVPSDHPFYLSTSSVGQGEGVVEPDSVENNILKFTPSAMTPNTMYYQCSVHGSMGWKINIVDPGVTVTNTPTPTINPYDISGDNAVTIIDYNLFLGRFGQGATRQQGNYNNNAKVDIYDYNVLIANFAQN